MSILTGKTVALLGGMGARGESRDALIAELGLAELTWIYSERNKVKEYANFCEAIKPGKYDYVFLLTKFINHKVWEHIKKANFGSTPLIKINGSYNAEGFVKAILEQAPIKEDKPEEVAITQPIVKRLLTPAEVDNSETKPQMVSHEPSLPKSNWEIVLGANTPEEVKARHNTKVLALEAQIKRLQENQQDLGVLKSAASLYNALVEFVHDYPTPGYLTDAKDNLFKSLQNHGVNVKESKEPVVSDFKTDIMLSNIVLSELFMSVKYTVGYFSENPIFNRHGACPTCGRHKSIGCTDNCTHQRIKKIHAHIVKGLKVAKAPDLNETAKFLKQRISEIG